eukprot:m.60087 g.60087  ORF g.60087 m.60087 type:complete len:211 (-) comp13053_c0_seq1:56-688(-)
MADQDEDQRVEEPEVVNSSDVSQPTEGVNGDGEGTGGVAAEPTVAAGAGMDPQVLDSLSQGLNDHMLPMVQGLEAQLREINESQMEHTKAITDVREALEHNPAFERVFKLMARLPHYQTKLASIRKDMLLLHEKSGKLKKRAAKVAAQRDKVRSKYFAEGSGPTDADLLAQPAPDLIMDPAEPAELTEPAEPAEPAEPHPEDDHDAQTSL